MFAVEDRLPRFKFDKVKEEIDFLKLKYVAQKIVDQKTEKNQDVFLKCSFSSNAVFQVMHFFK